MDTGSIDIEELKRLATEQPDEFERLLPSALLDEIQSRGKLLTKAADALEKLQAENARLKIELEEARNNEREGIACFLEGVGSPGLAAQVFAGMTRPVNEAKRNAAIDAALQQKG